MRRLGASVDWSREYFTMDDRLSVAVKEAFVRLYEQGLIYRGAYIVNWDPVQQTAVSDLEVTHQDRAGKLYHIRYPFADGTGSIVVATTRPETMLGDVAVAVNPNDERYRSSSASSSPCPSAPPLATLTERFPSSPTTGPSLSSAPARSRSPPRTIPTTSPSASATRCPRSPSSTRPRTFFVGSSYHGLDRFEARERIVADLEAAGLLVAVKDHQFAIALSQRTGAVIEPRLSMQWFVAVNKTARVPQRLAGIGTAGSRGTNRVPHQAPLLRPGSG
jgi:valyl-tRNA synthetase